MKPLRTGYLISHKLCGALQAHMDIYARYCSEKGLEKTSARAMELLKELEETTPFVGESL